MSLKKQVLKSKPVCKVTFRLSKEEVKGAGSVVLAGCFNDWDTTASMKQLKTGDFTTLLELEKGKSYEFRYLVEGAEWINDPEADRFVTNEFGEENSVVETI